MADDDMLFKMMAVTQPSVSRDRPARPDGRRVNDIASSALLAPHEFELELLQKWHINALLLGPEERCALVLDTITPTLAAPVVMWHPPDGAPPGRESIGTLVLRGAHHLDAADQQTVLAWLAGPSAPRVISTAAVSLPRWVAEGRFSRDLFYRLNTVCIPLDDSASDTSSQQRTITDA